MGVSGFQVIYNVASAKSSHIKAKSIIKDLWPKVTLIHQYFLTFA